MEKMWCHYYKIQQLVPRYISQTSAALISVIISENNSAAYIIFISFNWIVISDMFQCNGQSEVSVMIFYKRVINFAQSNFRFFALVYTNCKIMKTLGSGKILNLQVTS